MLLATISEMLGVTWWSILCFMSGALLGGPLWRMLRTKLKF